MSNEKNIRQFNKDISIYSGYLYTTKEKLSCFLANKRFSFAIKEMIGSMKGKTIIDVGCGDGTYTFEMLKYKPKYILGIDPAKEAIKKASSKNLISKRIKFKVQNIYSLDNLNQTFDIAVVRGVLHHLYDAPTAVMQLSKIARIIIVLEPNGYNPILKIIEKLSLYHRQHEEKSYFPKKLDLWFEQNHGKIIKRAYCGLVPVFCPDIIALILKKIEPLVENFPILNKIFCSVYVQKIHVYTNSKSIRNKS